MLQGVRLYEIRCPIYGFIKLNSWEWDVINQPAFQRLRRIRQLAWTDFVYPGAMHTRFEHSLGVMHMATLLFDGITERSTDLLSALGYDDVGLSRHRQIVRFAALLHDVGHGPFSHAAEELMPEKGKNGQRFKHEHYSAAIVRTHFADAIDNHKSNRGRDITADNVADLLEGAPESRSVLLWRVLIDGQIDADRMDYLLRDSHHAGVSYGRYDWQRLVNTVVMMPGEDGGSPRIGVAEGGLHAAESLVLARYAMFTQVYFHKTRVAYDHHLKHALSEILPKGKFPTPSGKKLEKYLEWDDWKVLGRIKAGKGGEHGERILKRDHYREIEHTKESPDLADIEILDEWKAALGDLLAAEITSEQSWYRQNKDEIFVSGETVMGGVTPLSELSSVVRNMEPIRQVRLYVRKENRENAVRALRNIK